MDRHAAHRITVGILSRIIITVRRSLFLSALAVAVAAQDPAAKARNPVIWADVPDVAVIRVGNVYYMSSTTMHMSPGIPIMRSTDLVDWTLINYAYDILEDCDALNLANGAKAYGKGSWASSLRHHNGVFYVSTFSGTTGKTYIYSTTDIEKGGWKLVSAFKPAFHDQSLFFDDDGRVYLIHGGGRIRITELKEDLSGVKPGGVDQVLIENASLPAGAKTGLPAEGSQLCKIDGRYYVMHITWPPKGMRTQLIHRADKLMGPYEGRILLQDQGVAQGTLIDTPQGGWFAFLFKDHGAVGRIPFVVPVTWKDGWPVGGVDGKVPMTLDIPAGPGGWSNLIASDDFDGPLTDRPNTRGLQLAWQWNHNPDHAGWSLTARPGFLRLAARRVDGDVLAVRNMLTQRTIGPSCTGSTVLDIGGLKAGDVAGIIALQHRHALVGVRATDQGREIVMIHAGSGKPIEDEVVPLPAGQARVHLRIACDFRPGQDQAYAAWSLDGTTWTRIGKPLKMVYALEHFMGYRYGLFHQATRQVGGHADFDAYRIADRIEGGDR